MTLESGSLAVLAVLAAVATLVGRSQAQGDFLNQINSSICTWGQLRAAIIRDTVYLDGGFLVYERGFSNGQVQPDSDDNAEGLLYTLDLSKSFNTETDNLTALFDTFAKAGGIGGNIAPTYHDGVMFANDDMFYLYGGLLENTDDVDDPPANTVLAYQAYQYGTQSPSWEPRFVSTNLNDGVTRYITNGAGVNAPSENMGWYISGMRAPGWGPIWNNETATNLSHRMITVDMSDMTNPVFANVSLPGDVPGRANAEAVWLPVAESGIIVLIGGVTELDSIFVATGLTDEQVEESERESPALMRTVSVYDVAGDRWYNQNTTGDIPPQLTQFCSVYASASDRSSHNIYIYGGYDGLGALNQSSDDVYVLSVPSFEWIQLYDGNGTANGRKEHKCVKPYPDKMLVLGGINIGGSTCIPDILRVFNLNTGRFQDTYNPRDWDEYKVPDLVAGRIGGDADGGATKTAPDSWTTAALADVFEASYTHTIVTYYPYNSTNDNITTTTVSSGGGGGFPGWAGAVIGVVLGLLLVVGVFVFWFLRRRRKRRGSRRGSEMSRGSRVMNWVNNAGAFAPPGPKDPDNSTTISGGFTSESTAAPSEQPAAVSRTTAEVAGDPVYEVHGHSAAHAAAVELPTSYNEGSLPVSSPAMSAAMNVSSPVSPEVPQEKEGDAAVRPTHTRNVSSLSSVQSYTPTIEDGSVQRPRYVSGVSDASVSSTGTRFESVTGYRGLGLEDIPDTEGQNTTGSNPSPHATLNNDSNNS
ncbi:hypothetical protein BDV11DRAFT_209430 [Aspergillus similis]